MKKKISIIYMGTPDFSVPALKKLASQENFTVPLVVTQPDRPKGRGKKLTASPVKEAAIELGLKVFQPEKINEPESVAFLKSLEPDFFVVAAFGQILSVEVLKIPAVMPVNIHASLLPRYRGSSPIQAAILNMDKVTGVTTMVMERKMDAGDILMTAETPISSADTSLDIHDRLGKLGGDLIVDTINGLADKTLTPVPQDNTQATYVKMLKKRDGAIDWRKPARQIVAHINAMTPWPGAFSRLRGKPTKIFKATAEERPGEYLPGVIYLCDEDGIHVATGEGSLVIHELMGSTGKRLTAKSYLLGANLKPPIPFDL